MLQPKFRNQKAGFSRQDKDLCVSLRGTGQEGTQHTNADSLSASDIPLFLVMSYFSKSEPSLRESMKLSGMRTGVHGDFLPGLDTGVL